MMKIILNSAYFPPIEYISLIYHADEILIENDEHWQKQSYRNRLLLYSANGVQHLAIPIIQKHHKMKMKDVEIDYKTEWQKQHWRTITAAYNNSPFFIYYQDFISPFYEKKIKFLLEYNTELLQMLLKLCKIEKNIDFTNEFKEEYETEIADYRDLIHPKKCTQNDYPLRLPYTYKQTFDYKYGFKPNLSILDLLCNKGNETVQYL